MLVWDGTRYRAVRGHDDGTVQVRGEDQLFSYTAPMRQLYAGAPSGADGYVQTILVPGGIIWHVTNITVRDGTTALTAIEYVARYGVADYTVEYDPAGIAAATWARCQCDLWLEEDDRIRVYCTGCLAADAMLLHVLGYTMTKE